MAIRRSRAQQSASHETLIRALYAEHGKALLAYTTRLTGDRPAAEDVVQETLIRAWRHPEVISNPRGSVRGWLMTVARNIVTDRYRAKAARPTEVAESESTPPVQRDHADSVVESMVLMDALDKLSPEHRDVLVEIYYLGRTVPETAGRLGIPEGTVKSRAHYALKALRKVYTSKSGGAARLKEVAA
ncbi:sigma-70 family RNA polymerase sigma factor [Streptomyces sp. TS71-3]|uniref:sigma-70 family RNA polymerase sigma factor n=1 Tax=Streptomyces sp. TS71-3 TaxID=2733862 RepID=UPI001B19BC9E|nr:sigma-70 family RNA polymerase sigma factor [Streptomyces sp. TS71-3]GHJ41725.1 DNA-directed RNA polymerase sigma-70 factor [Streptomyces sp. TS71-3]